MRLSVITINFNNALGLKKTLDSVFAQSYTEYEYIVIDGNSVDESKALIAGVENKLAYWVSEKDRGIYHAMNKGIAKASGEYLLFLNSGDCFFDDQVLANTSRKIGEHDIVYGNIIWDMNGVTELKEFPDNLTFGYFVEDSLPHQGAFIKRELFEKFGLYSEEYGTSADWAFFVLAICKHNVSYLHVPFCIAVCDRFGISYDPNNWQRILDNRNKLFNKEFPCFINEYKELKAKQNVLIGIQSSGFYKLYKKLNSIFKRNSA